MFLLYDSTVASGFFSGRINTQAANYDRAGLSEARTSRLLPRESLRRHDALNDGSRSYRRPTREQWEAAQHSFQQRPSAHAESSSDDAIHGELKQRRRTKKAGNYTSTNLSEPDSYRHPNQYSVAQQAFHSSQNYVNDSQIHSHYALEDAMSNMSVSDDWNSTASAYSDDQSSQGSNLVRHAYDGEEDLDPILNWSGGGMDFGDDDQQPREEEHAHTRNRAHDEERRSKVRAVSVWFNLDETRQESALDIVSKKRGLLNDFTKEILKKRLTANLCERLFSRDPLEVDNALAKLIPEKYGRLRPQWMGDMNDTEQDTLVRRMSRIASEQPDYIRNYFMIDNLHTDMAWNLLNGGTDIMRQWLLNPRLIIQGKTIAQREKSNPSHQSSSRGIRGENRGKCHNWEIALNHEQRKIVIDMVSAAWGESALEAEKRLGGKDVPPQFGLELLSVEDDGIIPLVRNLKAPIRSFYH
jgi:hypothetical protein